MSNLEWDDELSKLTVPQLIEKISELTTDYAAAVERITCEILIRSMQQAE